MKSLRRWVDLISSERGEDFICIADFILAEARISFFVRFQIHTQKRQKYLFCCAKDKAGGRILRFAQKDTSSVFLLRKNPPSPRGEGFAGKLGASRRRLCGLFLFAFLNGIHWILIKRRSAKI